jgi:hypothetical protein
VLYKARKKNVPCRAFDTLQQVNQLSICPKFDLFAFVVRTNFFCIVYYIESNQIKLITLQMIEFLLLHITNLGGKMYYPFSSKRLTWTWAMSLYIKNLYAVAPI